MPSPYEIREPGRLLSPSLVLFPDVIRANIEAMIRLAGSADRLRPHAKTHKTPEIIRLLEGRGISRHKCATLAEAEMIARAGGRDVLIAYPLVGPNLGLLAALRDRFPGTIFRVTVDDPEVAKGLSGAMASALRPPLPVLIDLEIGMGRTGIGPDRAAEIYRLVATLPGLSPDGLHAYDGQVRDRDPEARRRAAEPGIREVHALRQALLAEGHPVPRLILGGTPTFPIHAGDPGEGVECSPGTCVLHDAGYGEKFPDLPFTPAALLLTRVISRPRPGRLCLDLGHKAVAADPAGARLTLLGVPEATLGPQSEEHLTVETPFAADYPPGSPLLAIPTHVCPTVALHRTAYVVEGGELIDEWRVLARDRTLSV